MFTKLRELLPDSTEKKFELKSKIENNKLIIDIDFYLYKYDLYGKKFKLSIINECEVKMVNPVNWKKVVYENEFIIDWHSKKIVLNLNKSRKYSYNWNNINTKIKVLIEIDDKVFFDTKVNTEILNMLKNKTCFINSSNDLIRPKDTYEIIKSFNNLSPRYKSFIKIYLFFMIILWFTIILLPHIIILNFVLYLLVFKKFLKNYMTFWLKNNDFSSEDIEQEYKLSDIIDWKSSIDLHNVRIRVVASNIERWQNVRWSWKSRRTYTFEEPVNWLILHEEFIASIPKNTDIWSYIKWSFSFKKMYEQLYPAMSITNTHWIDVIWKIQLIHGELLDQEIIWPKDFMKYENFLKS